MPATFDPPIHVLLADDEEVYLRATAELLREDGFLVDTAMDAVEATRLLESIAFDVLVSDIRMPGNLHFEFIRQIGTLAPDLPVILVTAHPTVETATESVQLPVVAYLTKPVLIEELAGTILRCAREVRMRRAVGQYAERLATWSEGLHQLQGMGIAARGKSSKRLAQEVLGLSLGSIAGLLSDMGTLFQTALGEEPGILPCVLGQCPRQNANEQALRDTIKVLEQTRHSFKSKELGELRLKLEQQLRP
jgi:CheY-like chemotaxis protein